jgi:hypothetical protein
MWPRCEETVPFYELDALNGSHARNSLLKWLHEPKYLVKRMSLWRKSCTNIGLLGASLNEMPSRYCLLLLNVNLAHINGRIQIDGVWKQGTEENIRAQEEESSRRWRELRSDDIHGVSCSPNIIIIIGVVKSRSVKWARYVVHNGELRNAQRIFVRKHEKTR